MLPLPPVLLYPDTSDPGFVGKVLGKVSVFWLERRKGRGSPGRSAGARPLVFGSGVPARPGSLGTRPKAASLSS